MNNTELNSLLIILNITQDIADVSFKQVNKAFIGQAKLFHPDKAGDENTARMQAILDA